MYNGGTKSLKTILWKVMNHPLAAELSYDLAAEYAIEGIKLIGAPLSLVNRVSLPIKIENYKGGIPLDVVEVKGVKVLDDSDLEKANSSAMTYASDLFHSDLSCNKSKSCSTELTYIIEQGIIKTSFDEGYVQIAYKALPIDEDGFPLIPDNQKAALAIEYYILFRYLGPLYDVGKVTDKAWNRIETAKCWYMPSANSDMKLQSYDHIEGVMNTINRILINSNSQKNFFKEAGKKERLRQY